VQRGTRRCRELAAGRVAVVRRLRERRRHELVERRVQLGPHVGRSRRRLVQVREDDRQLGVAGEGTFAGEALVEDTAEGVHVRAAVDRSAFDLLGRHVVDRPDEAAIPGEARRRRHVAREAEVADERASLGDEDVAGLHVPVHEPRLVRRVETAPDLLDHFDGTLGLEAARCPEQAAEVDAFDQLHGEIQPAVGLARLERTHDVRVLDPPGKLRLAQEPAAESLVARAQPIEHLQRDGGVVRVAGAVDRAARALAEQLLDAVRTEMLEISGHRT
jgi:hypothetical protein